MKAVIENILSVAVNAPSGHNCQPWKFVIKRDSVYIWNLPDKDRTLFNHKQKGSLTAHGALIENIAITSSRKGFKTEIELFPEGNKRDLIARIDFIKSSERYAYEYLYPYIIKRTTNRRVYKKIPLEIIHQREIEKFIGSSDLTQDAISLVKEVDEISKAAKLFSVGDRVLFDNFYLHQALFSIVNWNLAEELRHREGLFVDTKELALPVKLIFRYVISHWRLLNTLSFLDLPSKMALKRESLYNHCSVIGLITSQNDSPREFVESGRVLQRLWLKVTSLGLSFQPISIGLLYLGQWVHTKRPNQLSQKQFEYVREAYEGILDLFKVHSRVPSFSFRIGYSDPPTASSLKKPPEIEST